MLARVPFSSGELVGGGGCNCAGDGDWNWGTGLRLRPPSPNKHSGEEGLHWLGRGRASGAERGARDQARSPGDVGLRGAGSREGCGTEVLEPLSSRGARAPGLPDRGRARAMALPALEKQTQPWQSPISHERVNPTHPRGWG